MLDLKNQRAISNLKNKFKWPLVPPNIEKINFGKWCLSTHDRFFSNHLSEKTNLIVELGTFLGDSARMMLRYAPNAKIICIDTWQPEHWWYHKNVPDMLPNFLHLK